MDIAIVGAGMAGLSCARVLADAGLAPVVFDKGRGLGGRLATRRTGELRFDHGAQFVTARGAEFQTYLDAHAAPWRPGGSNEWFVGTPAMNALVKPLAEGLDVRLGEAVAPQREAGGWRIGDARFERIVSTVPVVQARDLFPEMRPDLARVEVAPCWTLMVAFEAAPGWPEMWRSREGALAWIARNSAKPGRDGAQECWVVHAAPGWSRDNLERDADDARGLLLDLLRSSRGDLPPLRHAAAHRWRYAMTTRALGREFVASADGRLLIGGDWCLGARVEDAWISGRAMARKLVSG